MPASDCSGCLHLQLMSNYRNSSVLNLACYVLHVYANWTYSKIGANSARPNENCINRAIVRVKSQVCFFCITSSFRHRAATLFLRPQQLQEQLGESGWILHAFCLCIMLSLSSNQKDARKKPVQGFLSYPGLSWCCLCPTKVPQYLLNYRHSSSSITSQSLIQYFLLFPFSVMLITHSTAIPLLLAK